MKNELTTIDFTNKEIVKTLKETVAQGASDSEFAMFSEICKSSGLNPFKKEIWFIKMSGKPQIMTGINGFFAIANRHDHFNGFESGLITSEGVHVSASYPKDDFIGAWCKCYRKDRTIPTEAVAMLSEYKKNAPLWSTMKRVMIIKCAESVAFRKTFPQEMNGLYTKEEMPIETNISLDYKREKDTILHQEESNPYKFCYQMPVEISEDQKNEIRSELKLASGVFAKEEKLFFSPIPLISLKGYEHDHIE